MVFPWIIRPGPNPRILTPKTPKNPKNDPKIGLKTPKKGHFWSKMGFFDQNSGISGLFQKNRIFWKFWGGTRNRGFFGFGRGPTVRGHKLGGFREEGSEGLYTGLRFDRIAFYLFLICSWRFFDLAEAPHSGAGLEVRARANQSWARSDRMV